MTDIKYIPGNNLALGVTRIGRDTNFAVAIGGTDVVFLKLYKNSTDVNPEIILKLDTSFKSGNIFAVTVKNFRFKGYTYLYEAKGVTFVDPYAHLISGRETYGKVLSRKAKKMIRAYVWDNAFEWGDDTSPGIPFADSIIYKLHVRGFTKNAPGTHRGTFRGVVDKIPYLKELGINTLLLMPAMEYNEVYSAEPEPGVPEFITNRFVGMEPAENEKDKESGEVLPPDKLNPEGVSSEELDFLEEKDYKLNYWGYTAFYYFFAPKASYACKPQAADAEFKSMVKSLHAAGIEVFMEVVIPHEVNRSMVLDALRYWVREYHVDGFKLSLDNDDFNLIACDPYLSSAKLIAGGWNTNIIYPQNFYPESKRLAVYNDGYSVVARRFLKSDEGMSGDIMRMFTDNKGKTININYITDHNGFTLADLYMYDVKHNDANREKGRDGTDLNYSWNCGVEGPDKHKKTRDLRLKMRKNALAMLLLSQGVPLIWAGDEFGNSQGGNNNAYCQDNEVGWVNWKYSKTDAELLEFTKMLIKLRKEHPVFHNPSMLKHMDYLSSGLPDVSLHSPQAWYPNDSYYNRCVGVLYSGDYALIDHTKSDDCFYVGMNMYWMDVEYELPHLQEGRAWKLEFATVGFEDAVGKQIEGATIGIPGRSIVVLRSIKVDVPPKKPRKRNKAEIMRGEGLKGSVKSTEPVKSVDPGKISEPGKTSDSGKKGSVGKSGKTESIVRTPYNYNNIAHISRAVKKTV